MFPPDDVHISEETLKILEDSYDSLSPQDRVTLLSGTTGESSERLQRMMFAMLQKKSGNPTP